MYPLAFGVLVLQKGSAIAKSALVPALVTDDSELVTANSRLALDQRDRARSAARHPRSWCTSSSAPTGRCATARHLRGRGRSSRSRSRGRDCASPKTSSSSSSNGRRCTRRASCSGRARSRCCARASASSCSSPRSRSRATSSRWAQPGSRPTPATSAACSSAPALRRSVREEVILASSLVLPAIFTLLGAFVAGSVGFVLAALTIGIGAAAGRLGFDSLLQRDGPDAVRGARVRQVRDPLPARVGARGHRRDHPVRQADGAVPASRSCWASRRSRTWPHCAPRVAGRCARSSCPKRSTAGSRAPATMPSAG